jgi:HIRAN domain
MASGEWIGWEPPRNVIAGEASYVEALAALAGPICEDGYCIAACVTFVRDPRNAYDGNAFRAEVEGRLVGYLRRQLAEQLAPALDKARCRSFGVAGVIRGGSTRAPNLGCHVWLARRLTPGPAIEFDGDEWEVSWPPGMTGRTRRRSG